MAKWTAVCSLNTAAALQPLHCSPPAGRGPAADSDPGCVGGQQPPAKAPEAAPPLQTAPGGTSWANSGSAALGPADCRCAAVACTSTRTEGALRACLWLSVELSCHCAAPVCTRPAKHLGTLARASQSGSSTGCTAQHPQRWTSELHANTDLSGSWVPGLSPGPAR